MKIFDGVVFVGLLAIAASASAATTTTTTATTIACDSVECTDFDTAHSALQPFDSSLGTLTGITLQIDATSTTTYYAQFVNSSGPNPSSGSAELSFSSPFGAIVNGVSYSFEVAGAQTISVTGDPRFFQQRYTFTASGSDTFALDRTLFSYFIGTANVCSQPLIGSPTSGVCVTGQPESSPTLNNIVTAANNLILLQFGPTPYTTNSATYRLTYSYIPVGDVPEPASWMLMLLGFGAIGSSIRRARLSPSLPDR